MRPVVLIALVSACQPAPETAPTEPTADIFCDGQGEPVAYLVSNLRLVPILDGTSVGFDLDGPDADGCGVPDLVDPQGVTGIDNAFGGLIPALAVTEAAAIEPLINEAITQGNLLITFELADFDDPVDDPCVSLAVGRATGIPMVGTDGTVLWGQTLDRAAPEPDFQADGAIASGSLQTDLNLTLPVEIFGIHLDFELHQGAIRLTQQADGSVSGAFAGGVDVAYVVEVASTENVDPSLAGLLDALLSGVADLAPDENGVCTQVSMTLAFDTVPIFFFDDAR
jgi:hypothetical protein